MWFVLGIAAGIFADRVYPVPVSFVVNWVKSLWTKATEPAAGSPPPST